MHGEYHVVIVLGCVLVYLRTKFEDNAQEIYAVLIRTEREYCALIPILWRMHRDYRVLIRLGKKYGAF